MFRNSSSRPALNSSSGNFPLSIMRSRLRSTDGVSHWSLLTAAMHLARKFSLTALNPCSDSLLLGVSTVKLDAQIFRFFGMTSGYCTISSLHHLCPPFLVQFLLGTPQCAAQFQHSLGILQCVRTYPKCSVASTFFSHV